MTHDHFTQDEELLGRYVLGTLSAEERLAYDQHLQRCEICQRAVRNEQRVAAGVKRFGRDRMKQRLGDAVGAGMRTGISWQQLAGIAATVCIIAGIGILYRWWDVRKEQGQPAFNEIRSEETLRTAPVTPQEQAAGAKSDTSAFARARQGEAASDEGVASKKVTNAPSAIPTDVGSDIRLQDTRTGRHAEGGKEAAKNLATATPPEPGVKATEGMVRLDAAQQVGGTQQSQTFWVQGVLIPSPAASGPSAQPYARQKLEKDKAGNARVNTDELKIMGVSRDQEEKGIEISQRPSSLLPASQQQADDRRREITTEVGLSDSRTTFVLYLDTLLDSTELHAARVRYVMPDSLVMEIGGRSIGYRMPKDWPQTRTARTR